MQSHTIKTWILTCTVTNGKKPAHIPTSGHSKWPDLKAFCRKVEEGRHKEATHYKLCHWSRRECVDQHRESSWDCSRDCEHAKVILNRNWQGHSKEKQNPPKSHWELLWSHHQVRQTFQGSWVPEKGVVMKKVSIRMFRIWWVDARKELTKVW